MSSAESLRIRPTDADATLNADQKRFNTLTQKIAQTRKKLLSWRSAVSNFRTAYTETIPPLAAAIRSETRAWLFKLDALTRTCKWTRPERNTIHEIVCEASGALLAEDGNDPELQALFARYAGVDFQTERQDLLKAAKDFAETLTGVDLGKNTEIEDEVDLFERLQKAFAEKMQADDQASRPQTNRRRASSAATARAEVRRQQREQEVQVAAQSLREIYRKLASALHPDRETDEIRRNAKTEMMQRVNQAYAANDLFALFALQLEIEQIDARHIEKLSIGQLRHYNTILAGQLAELRKELDAEEFSFLLDFELHPAWKPNASSLRELLMALSSEAQAALAKERAIKQVLDDYPATKRWLKSERRRLRNSAMFLPGFSDLPADDPW